MKKKKGFTLVELLVVIAILAILAAVSVVGYLGFTERAKLSNDQTTIKMLNDNLMAEFVEKRPETAGDAITRLENLGVTKEKLVAYSNNHHYAYDLDNNRFVLLDDKDNVIYPEGASKSNLTGLYMGNVSDNIGVENYVIFEPLTDSKTFAEFLNGTTTINIDLNDKYLYFKDAINVEINVSNGFYVATDQKVNSDASASQMTDVMKNGEDNWNTTLTKTYYENVIFDYNGSGTPLYIKPGEKTTFKNCLFLLKIVQNNEKNQITAIQFNEKGNPSNDKEPNHNTSLEFDGCYITNSQWIQTDIYNITVNECIFSNCSNGINLQTPSINATITNNIFDLTQQDTDASGNPRDNNTVLMFSPMYENEKNVDFKYNVKFTGNKVNQCKSLIMFHSGQYINNNKGYLKADPTKLHFYQNEIDKVTGNLVECFSNKDGAVSFPEDVLTNINKLIEAIKNYNN